MISYCAVYNKMIESPEVEQFSYDDFLAYVELGSIVENELGNLSQVKRSYRCATCRKSNTQPG